MADHSKPTLVSTYANFVSELNTRLNDLALGLDSVNTSPTNLPTNSIRWDSVGKKWQKYGGSTWSDLTTAYNININGTVGATSASTGAFTTINASGVTTLAANLISDSTTESTSILTGAIQTDGGIGIAKSLWVGGNANFAGNVTVQSILSTAGDIAVNGGNLTTTATTATLFNTNATNLSVGSASVALTLGAISGTITLRNPTIQTSVTSGTLTLFSGVTTGAINIGSSNAGGLKVNFTTASTSSTTGAFIVSGGMGIAGVSYFGNDVFLSGTGAIAVPVGTEAQRPSGAAGKIRFNSTVNKYEGHNGTIWSSIGGGATGGGSDDIFIENGQTVTADYTITTGKNAMSTGPVSINTDITVTIPTDSVWVII